MNWKSIVQCFESEIAFFICWFKNEHHFIKIRATISCFVIAIIASAAEATSIVDTFFVGLADIFDDCAFINVNAIARILLVSNMTIAFIRARCVYTITDIVTDCCVRWTFIDISTVTRESIATISDIAWTFVTSVSVQTLRMSRARVTVTFVFIFTNISIAVDIIETGGTSPEGLLSLIGRKIRTHRGSYFLGTQTTRGGRTSELYDIWPAHFPLFKRIF